MFTRATPSLKPTKKIRILPFLRGLLNDPTKSEIIRWIDKANLKFEFINHHKVAELWGATKPGRKVQVMKYDTMARSLREFVKANMLEKIKGRNCTFRFIETPAFGIDRILSPDFGRKVFSYPPSTMTTREPSPFFDASPSNGSCSQTPSPIKNSSPVSTASKEPILPIFVNYGSQVSSSPSSSSPLTTREPSPFSGFSSPAPSPTRESSSPVSSFSGTAYPTLSSSLDSDKMDLAAILMNQSSEFNSFLVELLGSS